MPISRRQFMQIGVQVAAVAATSRFLISDAFAQTATAYQSTFAQLDAFVEQYMRDMNSPGMTLVLADRAGVQRVATYGFGDLEHQAPVAADALFEIGSITKSFVANCLLQLRDEGKLDLHKPITDCLPWLRIASAFDPITTHHLLTHTSGLPGNQPLFLTDPNARHTAANPPGKYFHYCNTAFEALGHLLWTLDGRPIDVVIRKRIFEPLGMSQSEPVITIDIRDRMAKNYYPSHGDWMYPRYGKLSEAPAIISTDGAGCIASTPCDMGLYIQMLANRGKGPHGRVLSDDGFALFSTPHIKADEFGPTASYGYGIAVDKLDGHTILRHTGGMVSFASAIHVDLDEGIGAFASINAMQGYRPNPVVQYAIQLMRAQRARTTLPKMPARDEPTRIDNAADYAGVYRSADGRSLEFVAEAQRMFLLRAGVRVAIESGGDGFLVLHPDFARFLMVFERADPKNEKSRVVAMGWGGDWYTNSSYTGPATFDVPAEWTAFEGHYRNESPWVGSLHILTRKGKLMIDGVVPLEASSDGTFYLRDEEHSPEWIRFADIVNGKAMRLKYSGDDMWRVMAA